MKRGEWVTFQVNNANGEWSKAYKGVVDSNAPHEPLRVYMGLQCNVHYAINFFPSDNTYLRSTIFLVDDPNLRDITFALYVDFGHFNKNVPEGMHSVWKLRFCKEAKQATLTFLLCCKQMALHKDIVTQIAQLVYFSEWDQIWRRVHWGRL